VEREGQNSLQPREHRVTVEREHMHVVVQNGRLFQQDDPDIRVILDPGALSLGGFRSFWEYRTSCYFLLSATGTECITNSSGIHRPMFR
jgi:hypothetical protein